MNNLYEDNPQMYRNLVEKLPVVLFDTPASVAEEPYYVSPQIEHIFGVKAEHLQNFTEVFYNSLHEDDRDSVITEWNKARNEHSKYSLECRIQSPGREAPVWLLNEGSFTYDDNDMPLRHIGVLIDISDRKLREKTLLESEERYRKITESMSDYVYTVRVVNGKVVETVHGGACQPITGYSPDEFAENANLWIEMVHEHDRDLIAKRAIRMLGGEDVEQVEHRIIHKSGQVRWVNSTVVPHRDDNGKVMFFDGVIRDITEQKRQEEIEQQRSYVNEMLLDSIPFAAVLLQEDGEVIAANCAGLDMGFSPGQSWNLAWEQMNCACECTEILEKAMYHDVGRQQAEIMHQGRHYEATFVPMEPDLCLCCFYDITDRKRYEENLAEDKLLMNAIMDNTVTTILILNPYGRIEAVNFIAGKVLDMSPAELTGMNISDIFSAPEAARKMENVHKAVNTRKFVRFHDEINRHFFDTMLIPVLDEGNHVIKVAMFARDITEQLRSEANLLEAYQTLTTLVEQSPVAIITLNLEGVVKSWNPASEKLFGWKAADVCGKHITLFGDPPPPEVSKAWEDAFKGNFMVERLETKVQLKAGGVMKVLLTGSPLMDADGNPKGAILIVEDV